MQRDSVECYCTSRRRWRKRSALQTTCWRPLRTDLSLALPRLCPSLALSLMLSFCLALTDLLRGRDQNESPAPSSSLAFAPSSSTDSFSSLVLPQSFLVPWPEKLPSWALKKKERKGGKGRRWGGGENREERKGWGFCFCPCGLLEKIFHCSHTNTQTRLFLSFSARGVIFYVYLQLTSGGISWWEQRTVCQHQGLAHAYRGKCYLLARLTDASCRIQSVWLACKKPSTLTDGGISPLPFFMKWCSPSL